ncbi:transglutaminase-like cysteine peptidase [Bradyrhizobium sp. LTSP857]|uniref:transglutaminase-like cysteine peptidase n=1 Tax=Bradyrhizobium sp. LTSP857 TaxID=1619231 RepID=UPI0007C7974F|nr:transglutaminase-like cysteine peptidase [Bradyrhizobium sp. LTSP857]
MRKLILRAILPIFFVQPCIPPVHAEFTLPPFQYTAFCAKYPSDCKSQPPSGMGLELRKIQLVNTAVNAQITPSERTRDTWELYPREGDCGDYAVSKRHLLLSLGGKSSQLLLAEVLNRKSGEHHLILIVLYEGGAFALDNLYEYVLPLDEAVRQYQLLRVASPDNPNIWRTSLPLP